MPNNDNNFSIIDVNASYTHSPNADSDSPVNTSTDNPVQPVYLSEVIDVLSLLNSPLTEEQRTNPVRRIYFIKAPMGSGKTHIIKAITRYYNTVNQPVGHMLVYKKNIEDIVRGTVGIPYRQLLSQSSIRNSRSYTPVRDFTIQTYTKQFFDVYAEHIIALKELPEGADIPATVGELTDPHEIVDAYLKDRVILVDEADYIINMIQAFARNFIHNKHILAEKRLELLKEAAKQFYRDISAKCRALVLFSATSTSEYMDLLPAETVVIDPNDYLQTGQQLKSISIVNVTYVPFVEYDMKSGIRLTDQIIEEILIREQPNKALLFVPRVFEQDTRIVAKNHKTVAFMPPNKASRKAIERMNLSPEIQAEVARMNRFTQAFNKTAKKRGLKPVKEIVTNEGLEHIEGLADFYRLLDDTIASDYFLIIVTGSNCRGADLQAVYEKVVVITDAPLNAEVIQALGRYRNCPVHAYILESWNSWNVRNCPIIDMETGCQVIHDRRNASHWQQASSYLYGLWEEVKEPRENPLEESERINTLIDKIEDFDFTLSNSMTPFNIGVDLRYCSPAFEPKLANVPDSVNITKKAEEDKKGGKVLQFLTDNPDLSINEAVQQFKAAYPDEKVSRPTIIKYRKLLKGQG